MHQRFTVLSIFLLGTAQPSIFFAFPHEAYWQQRVQYTIRVEVDPEVHRMRDSERLVYFNNSPDTLQEVYYHLYLNAFKPGSMMEKRAARLRTALGKRLRALTADQQGWTTVKHLRQGSQELQFDVHDTILRAELFEALAPGDSTELQMEFESQIPKQTRRIGRDNVEGVDYSMCQWYPSFLSTSARSGTTTRALFRDGCAISWLTPASSFNGHHFDTSPGQERCGLECLSLPHRTSSGRKHSHLGQRPI